MGYIYVFVLLAAIMMMAGAPFAKKNDVGLACFGIGFVVFIATLRLVLL